MNKLLLATIAVLAAAPVFGQDLIVSKTDGTTASLDLEKIHKISFSEGNMVATSIEGTNLSTYTLSAISMLQFTNSTDVDAVEIMDGRISYSAVAGVAYVSGSAGQTFSVFNLSGSTLLTQPIESDSESVDLSALQSGVYLLRLGSKTIKIVR